MSANLPGRASHKLRDDQTTLCGRRNNGSVLIAKGELPDCFTCRNVMRQKRITKAIQDRYAKAFPLLLAFLIVLPAHADSADAGTDGGTEEDAGYFVRVEGAYLADGGTLPRGWWGPDARLKRVDRAITSLGNDLATCQSEKKACEGRKLEPMSRIPELVLVAVGIALGGAGGYFYCKSAGGCK